MVLPKRSTSHLCGHSVQPPVVVGVAWIVLVLAPLAHAQSDDFDGPPINYRTAEVCDPVATLSRKVDAGKMKLKYEVKGGYLNSVLKALDIPISSQTLVFSKTSLQQSRISPRSPRAIYFNDDVYVGYCQNGDVLEFASTDAKQGAMFYTLEQRQNLPPQFIRDQGQCLACHSSNRTQNVPGYLIRSVFANAFGRPEFGSGTFTTDHTSPLEERWGGWYVSGTHGNMRHMGNAILNNRTDELDRDAHANLTSLSELVSTEPYPTSHSDIVALMVMEHQTQMHNAIAWANYETRKAVHQSETMNEALNRPKKFLSESSERRIDHAADRVLEFLLMRDEFPLTSPVKGTSGFTEDFQARGNRDSLGRSLRDFDLETRMFRYPCSYLIYSDAFDGLHEQVRGSVLRKLKQVLEGELAIASTVRYTHLSKTDRSNIKQILTETKPAFSAINGGTDS